MPRSAITRNNDSQQDNMGSNSSSGSGNNANQDDAMGSQMDQNE
jgi:hypothetical protein